MSEVVLSSAVRSNLLNLQSTAELLGKTQTRLATGKKVNSALDNPTNFFTASSLNSRAADLGRLLDSVSNAIQTEKPYTGPDHGFWRIDCGSSPNPAPKAPPIDQWISSTTDSRRWRGAILSRPCARPSRKAWATS